MLVYETSDKELADSLYDAITKEFGKTVDIFEGCGLSMVYTDPIQIQIRDLPERELRMRIQSFVKGFVYQWNFFPSGYK